MYSRLSACILICSVHSQLRIQVDSDAARKLAAPFESAVSFLSASSPSASAASASASASVPDFAAYHAHTLCIVARSTLYSLVTHQHSVAFLFGGGSLAHSVRALLPAFGLPRAATDALHAKYVVAKEAAAAASAAAAIAHMTLDADEDGGEDDAVDEAGDGAGKQPESKSRKKRNQKKKKAAQAKAAGSVSSTSNTAGAADEPTSFEYEYIDWMSARVAQTCAQLFKTLCLAPHRQATAIGASQLGRGGRLSLLGLGDSCLRFNASNSWFSAYFLHSNGLFFLHLFVWYLALHCAEALLDEFGVIQSEAQFVDQQCVALLSAHLDLDLPVFNLTLSAASAQSSSTASTSASASSKNKKSTSSSSASSSSSSAHADSVAAAPLIGDAPPADTVVYHHPHFSVAFELTALALQQYVAAAFQIAAFAPSEWLVSWWCAIFMMDICSFVIMITCAETAPNMICRFVGFVSVSWIHFSLFLKHLRATAPPSQLF